MSREELQKRIDYEERCYVKAKREYSEALAWHGKERSDRAYHAVLVFRKRMESMKCKLLAM